MPLEAYKRRHSQECLKALANRVASKEIRPLSKQDLEEYRHCKCAWWVRGISDYGKPIPRQSLKVYSWEAAKAELKRMNQPDTPAGEQRVTVQDAVAQWMAEIRLSELSPQTVKLYDLCGRKLLAHCAGCGVHLIREVSPVHINAMRAAWVETKMARSSHRNYLTWMGTLFTFSLRMGWLTANPMQRIKPVRRQKKKRSDPDEEDGNVTLPIDENGHATYDLIISQAGPFLRNELDRPGAKRKRARRGALCSHPENFTTLLQVMYETGLRVSDAVHFDVDAMAIDKRGGVYTTTQIKTGTDVTVFLDPWLAEKVRSLPRLCSSKFVFFDGRKNWRVFVGGNVRSVLSQLGAAIGVEKLRPHRFRDSFAVNKFNAGVSLEDVSRLLGHSSISVTERHYSPWVPSRAESLRDRVQGHSSSKVVNFPGKKRRSA